MKTLLKPLALVLCVYLIYSQTIQVNEKTPFVYDQENDLTEAQERRFDSLFHAHEKRTSNEIVLVTTANYGDEENMLMYSVNFGDKHGVGKKELKNGVVIVFSKAQRETRISTGYGTERVLKDEIAKKIIDSLMLPQFKQDNYFEGLWAGSLAVVNFLDKPENKITRQEK